MHLPSKSLKKNFFVRILHDWLIAWFLDVDSLLCVTVELLVQSHHIPIILLSQELS